MGCTNLNPLVQQHYFHLEGLGIFYFVGLVLTYPNLDSPLVETYFSFLVGQSYFAWLGSVVSTLQYLWKIFFHSLHSISEEFHHIWGGFCGVDYFLL
jgi:hypothetical protein